VGVSIGAYEDRVGEFGIVPGWLTGTAKGEVMAADEPSEGQAVEQRRRGWWLVKGETALGLTYDPRQRLTGSWQGSVHVPDGWLCMQQWQHGINGSRVGREGCRWASKAEQRAGGCRVR
jgi:hypothetical protein